MAIANYSLPFTTAAPLFVSSTPAPGQGSLDDLLYAPEEHQHESEITHGDYRNNPFTPPATQRRNKLKKRSGISYLPPPNQFTHYPRPEDTQPNFNALHFNTQMNQYNHNPRLPVETENQRVHETGTSPFNTGEYIHDPSGDYDNYERRRIDLENSNNQRPPAPNYGPKLYYENPFPLVPSTESTPRRFESTVKHTLNFGFVQPPSAPTPPKQQTPSTTSSRVSDNKAGHDRQPGFTKVETGASGGKTQLHAVLDYDDPDYYDDIPGGTGLGSPVTPLQGPILVKNGTVPVVPLYSYPTVNNGSFLQIPILWTALSLALGYELQGQVVKGIPCVKRNYQLYCPTAGNTYPLDKIESFIDENKALMKRMYGVFETKGGAGGTRKKRNTPGVPDLHAGDSYFRHIRQANRSPAPPPSTQQGNSTGRVDACESTTEITTPYWALNSARKVRAIVNTMHFEQAIHQEVCSKTTTGRCSGDCGCEQKYKWHRLLAYDPEDDCAGIFMDWFLFPSCCVCRCNP